MQESFILKEKEKHKSYYSNADMFIRENLKLQMVVLLNQTSA